MLSRLSGEFLIPGKRGAPGQEHKAVWTWSLCTKSEPRLPSPPTTWPGMCLCWLFWGQPGSGPCSWRPGPALGLKAWRPAWTQNAQWPLGGVPLPESAARDEITATCCLVLEAGAAHTSVGVPGQTLPSDTRRAPPSPAVVGGRQETCSSSSLGSSQGTRPLACRAHDLLCGALGHVGCVAPWRPASPLSPWTRLCGASWQVPGWAQKPLKTRG